MIVLYLYFLVFLLQIGYSSQQQQEEIDNPFFIINKLSFHLSQVAVNTVANITPSISEQCLDTLTKAFITEKSIYKFKFIKNSSKMINDVSSYKDCFFNYYHLSDNEIALIKNNITFVVFYNLESNFSNFNSQKKKIYGFCLPRGCSESEYARLFVVASKILFPFSHDKVIKAFDMNDQTNHFKLLHIIPIILLFSFFSMSLFRNFIFPKPFKKNKDGKRKESKNNGGKEDHSEQFSLILFELRECFALNDNCEELMRNNITIYDSNLYDESGLSLITGTRAIAMIIVVIGAIFETVSLSPIMSSDKHLTNLFLYPSLAFLLFCQRFGKKFCYCISGITLMYKMVNYLDREVEQLENQNNIKPSNYHLLPVDIQNEAFKNYHNKLKWSSFLYFFMKYFYKYILFWFFGIFFKFSFYDLVSIIFYSGPLWIYFKRNIVETFSLTTMLGIEYIQNPQMKLFFSKTNPFNLATNEVNFFIISIFFIFICYKHNLKMDFIILYGIFICVIGKYILYNLWLTEENNINKLYPAKSFLFSINGYLLKSTPYNLIYFLIGLFFGLLNYRIQKANLTNKNKAFLNLADIIIPLFQSRITKLFLIFGIVLIIFFVLSYYLLFQWLYDDIHLIGTFLSDYYINLFYLYDNEMLIILFFFVVYRILFFNESALIACLKHQYWNCITRPYWLFTVTVYFGTNYLFYQNDMNINLDFRCLLFFSVLGISIIGIADSILFILLDVPLKKMTYYAINYFRQSNKDERSTSFSDHSIN